MSQPFSVQFGSIPTYCFSRFLITQLWGRYLLNVSFLLFFFLRTGNASETFLGFCMGFFQSAVGIHPDAAEAHGSHCQVQLAVWMGLFWLPVYPAPWQCVRFLMWLKRMAHRAIVNASSFIFCSIGTETQCESMMFFSIPLCSGKVWGCLFFFFFSVFIAAHDIHLFSFATTFSVQTKYEPDRETGSWCWLLFPFPPPLGVHSGQEPPYFQAELAPLLELTQPTPEGNCQLFLGVHHCLGQAPNNEPGREGLQRLRLWVLCRSQSKRQLCSLKDDQKIKWQRLDF